MLEDETFFGDAWALKFLHTRYIFCPVDIEEDTDGKYTSTWRLPFLDETGIDSVEPVDLPKTRKGGFGTVTKEVIAVGHLRFKNRNRRASTAGNWSNNRFACKRIDVHGDFVREKENHMQLKKGPAIYPNIMPLFATVTIGTEFNLIFELADMDLRELPADTTGNYTLCDLVTEPCNLTNALTFLHASMYPRMIVCHLDVKPENILVVFDKPRATSVGTWKICDFGISMVSTPVSPPLDVSVKSFSFPYNIGGQGVRLPPEASNDEDMGPKSDVWSLGCILVRLLAFGIGGASELKKFDTKLHQSDDGYGRYQHNSFYQDDPLRLNPHVETWLQELPTHKDTRLPFEACERLRDLLFQMLQIDMLKRLKSRRAEAEL